MTRTVRIIVAVVIVVLTIPALLLLAPMLAAHSSVQRDAHPAYNCSSHSWKRYIGVSPYPGMLADFRVHAHVCWWERTGHGHYKGQVIDKKTATGIKFNTNSAAALYGFEVWKYDKYNTSLGRDAFSSSVGFWSQWRVCQNIGGIRVCDPTGNFVPFWEFHTPYQVRRSDGSISKWAWHWHVGKPGQSPSGIDSAIKYGRSD